MHYTSDVLEVVSGRTKAHPYLCLRQ